MLKYLSLFGRGTVQFGLLFAALVGVFLAWQSSEAARSAAEASQQQVEATQRQVEATQQQLDIGNQQAKIDEQQAALSILPYISVSPPPSRIAQLVYNGQAIAQRKNYRSGLFVGVVGGYVHLTAYLVNEGRDFAVIRGWGLFAADGFRTDAPPPSYMLGKRFLQAKGADFTLTTNYLPPHASDAVADLRSQVLAKEDLIFDIWYEDFHGRRYESHFLMRWHAPSKTWLVYEPTFERRWN
jgi:hypothetical protein